LLKNNLYIVCLRLRKFTAKVNIRTQVSQSRKLSIFQLGCFLRIR